MAIFTRHDDVVVSSAPSMACMEQLGCAKATSDQQQLKYPVQKVKSPEHLPGGLQRRSSGFTSYLTSWLQLSLAAMFFSEAFVYSIIEPYLPQALSSAPSIYLSLTFGAYSISQLAATVLLVLLQVLPRVAAIRPKHDYFIATTAFIIYAVTGCLATAVPGSIGVMLLQRVLLGLAAAVFSVHAYKGVARALSPQDALSAIACINAGLVAGDSVAPIIGDLVYRLAGVRVVSGIQPAVCAAAALLILALPASLAIRTRHIRQCKAKQLLGRNWLNDAVVNIGPESDQQQQLPHGAAKPLAPTGPTQDQASNSRLKLAEVQAFTAKAHSVSDNSAGSHQTSYSIALNAATSSSSTAADRIRLLWQCLCNLSLTLQLCVLVLTQFASSLISILIPEALQGKPLWMVPALFAVQAVCSIVGPFVMDAAISKWPKLNTALLMAVLVTALAAASGTALPAAAWSMFAALFICCAVAGAACSTLEVLVFHHATHITTATGCDVAADMGAILYTFYYCAGNTLGGMVGGAAADMNSKLQIHVAEGVSGLILVYAVALFVAMHMSRRKFDVQMLPG